MEDDPAVAAVKGKYGAKQKIQNKFRDFSEKMETIDNQYQRLQMKLRRGSEEGCRERERSSAEASNFSAAAEGSERESNVETGEDPPSGVGERSEDENPKSGEMELYYFDPSPPCRAVILFLHAIGLDPIMREVDIANGENLKPDFLKLNPQGTVPVIVDDGFVLSESRAILGYLAERYGRANSTYYPNDAKARGVINQRLMFDIGTLYQRFLDAYTEMFFSTGPAALDDDKLSRLGEAFEFLETFMGDSDWMAGDEVTIADYSLVVTVSTVEACGFDLSKYRKVSNWLKRCKSEMVNYDAANQKGADIFGKIVKEKLKTG